MVRNKYSDEFKLAVVKEYYEGQLGVRALAKKYNLPSKNYISNWIVKLKKEGKIPKDWTVTRTSNSKDAEAAKGKTAYEKELEKENEYLKAKIAFLYKCKEIEERNKKKRNT